MDTRLIGRWMHSREEDSGAQQVFRPAAYEFPPARGREGFELRPDGGLTLIGFGPTDAQTESAGRWELTDDGTLVLHQPSGSHQRYKVVAPEKGRLVLEPQ